jgi:hypothetical protein
MTLAQLHVNLAYFHGIILLNRPFFLQKIINLLKAGTGNGTSNDAGLLGPPSKSDGKRETSSTSAEPFPPACVKSAVYSIDAVQSALLKRALPRRDPFVIYWLFTAALIVFSNGFVPVCNDVDTAHSMQTVLNLFQYLGEVDALARRYSQILVGFGEAIRQRRTVAPSFVPTGDRKALEGVFEAFFGSGNGVSAAEATSAATSQPARAEQQEVQTPAGDSRQINATNANNRNINTNTHLTPAMQVAANWQPYFQPSNSNSNSISNTQPSPSLLPQQANQSNTLASGLNMDHGNLMGMGISPPDYSLDFDAFLSSVGQLGGETGTQDHEAYGMQEMWMPLYGTMDMH